MANTPIPTQVDYTSRDYASLRDDMIARVKESVPEWSAADPSDFGVALVEAFAYLGDLMSYYIDRAANESTLSTATRRATVVALARDLGYEPSGFDPATVRVTLTNNEPEPFVIPKSTLLSANIETSDFLRNIPFETNDDIEVPANGVASVTCTQGETRSGFGYGEALGVSRGEPSQVFEVLDANVVKESVQVYVYDGVNYFPWQRVEHLSDYSPLSRVYRVRDFGNATYVEFGDGISGLIPPSSHVLYAEYRVVDGLKGNVPAGTVTEITSIPGLTDSEVAVLVGSLTVTNDSPATGGTDPEELESIRKNATQVYRTFRRAVTLEDYQNIALSVPTCGKSNASSSVPGNVIVAVAPYRNTGSAEERPGFQYNAATSAWEETEELIGLKAAVLSEIERSALAGSTTTVISPVYTYIDIEIAVDALPSVRQADAETIVKQAITERLDYARVGFGSRILLNDLIAVVSSLGISETATVTVLKKKAVASGAANLEAADDEILLLLEEDLVITVTGGAEAA